MMTTRTGTAIRYIIAGALAASLVAGAASAGEETSRQRAETALAKGKVDRAIAHGEAAVAANPQDVAARLVLAQAYLKAGRFDSAATTFNDALDLGDTSARTALSLALANVAAGRSTEAVAVLDDWRGQIPAGDLGLAYALAGETGRGVAILADALRGGENTPKLRQNLAYAYALDGRWREARLMVEEDVPAGDVDERIGQWAAMARPEDGQQRVAALLSVPLVTDLGQPARLALNLPPATQQLADAATAIPAPDAASPILAAAETPFGGAPVAVAPVGPGFVSQPVIQPLPQTKPRPTRVAEAFGDVAARAASAPATSRPAAARPAAERPVRATAAAKARASGGSHLVQLGSFTSEAGARRAWGIFTARNPELRNYRMAINPAVVQGRNVWRVAAAGLNPAGAAGLCAKVKGRGGACFAYAGTAAPAGTPARSGAAGQFARRR